MDLSREVPGFNGKFVINIKGETATCWNTNWRNTGKTKQVSNAMEAERQLGIYKLNARISENCNNKRDTASGYIWRYA